MSKKNETKEKKEAVQKDVKNGVTRPKEGTLTGQVWAIADAISRQKKAPARRAEVIEKATAEGINKSTATTQYGRWRVYNDVPAEKREPKPKAAKKAARKKAASTPDTTVE